MDALSFKNALREVRPTAESLAGIGLQGNDVAEISASFEVRERGISKDNNLPDATLHDLFVGYDVTSVAVGMVRFRGVPEQVPYGYIIGEVEADYLALEAGSGEITVHDITRATHVIWSCAQNGASLLSALAEAAKYLGACITVDQSGSDVQRQSLDRCTLLAGGPKYRDFYRMLLGVA